VYDELRDDAILYDSNTVSTNVFFTSGEASRAEGVARQYILTIFREARGSYIIIGTFKVTAGDLYWQVIYSTVFYMREI
jgi:predicted acetyltransferase